jgi:hypothetical protein
VFVIHIKVGTSPAQFSTISGFRIFDGGEKRFVISTRTHTHTHTHRHTHPQICSITSQLWVSVKVLILSLLIILYYFILILSLLIIFSSSFSCFRYTVQGKEILRKSITYSTLSHFFVKEDFGFHLSVYFIPYVSEMCRHVT